MSPQIDLSDAEENDFDDSFSHTSRSGDSSLIIENDNDLVKTKKRKIQQDLKHQSKNKAKKSKDSRFSSIVDTKEIQEIKETENQFGSNLFKLQISELLNEIRIKQKRRKQIDHFVSNLKRLLLSMPTGKQHEINEDKWLGSIHNPVKLYPKSTNGKFSFVAPSDVRIIGSYLHQTCIKPDVVVDLVMEIPKSFFAAKDFLNHRYVRKRSLYLCYVAKELIKEPLVKNLSFLYHLNNHYKPIIAIEPSEQFGKLFTINLHVTAEVGTFDLGRFDMTKSNINSNWYLGDKRPTNEQEKLPTPFYNTTILQDLTVDLHTKVLSDALNNNEQIANGICLLKVWLRQRNLDKGYGCMSGFLMSKLVAYLIQINRLNYTMSCFQVFRIVLLFISQSDFQSITMNLSTVDIDVLNEKFQSIFLYKFIDSSSHLNLFASLSAGFYQRLKHEANLAIGFLEKNLKNTFDLLFMTTFHAASSFDQIFHVNTSDIWEQSLDMLTKLDKRQDFGPNEVLLFVNSIENIVSKALSRRVHFISVLASPIQKWKVTEPFANHSTTSLTIGVCMNDEVGNSMVDRGPAADSLEAADFQLFWGEKSELRRFQDGTISEAVVWPGRTQAEKRRIILEIVKYVLTRHASIPSSSVIHHCLDNILNINQSVTPTSTGEEQLNLILESYESLRKELRSLTRLSLAFSSIQSTSPALRYTETYPQIPTFIKRAKAKKFLLPSKNHCVWFTPVYRIVCSLEQSGKWPSDIEALKHLKTAFYLNLSQLIREQLGFTSSATTNHLDILKNGYVFRLQITVQKELKLLNSLTPQKQSDFKKLDTETIETVLPRMSSSLQSISLGNASYSLTARLAKRWLSSQMLLDYITQEAVELIVAHVYLHPEPFSVPCSSESAFLRFLLLLASFDWANEPLLVNLNDDFSDEQIKEIKGQFKQSRSQLPPMVILSPFDKFDSRFTVNMPSTLILKRIKALAKNSHSMLLQQLNSVSGVDLKVIFRPPLDIYNLFVKLNHDFIPRAYQSIDPPNNAIQPQTTSSETDEDIKPSFPVLEFDPVQLYLKELRRIYGHLALFFHDTFGGDFIAVLWRPDIKKEKGFRIEDVKDCKPLVSTESNVKLVLNLEAITEDFKQIGYRLVDKITEKI